MSFKLSIEQYKTVTWHDKYVRTERPRRKYSNLVTVSNYDDGNVPPGPTEMALDKFRSSANRRNIPEIVSEPVLYVFRNATCSFSLQSIGLESDSLL